MIALYSMMFMNYESSFAVLRFYGVEYGNMDTLIEAAAGVCRHKTSLLVYLLRETGFNTIEVGLSPQYHGDPGHAWVEIEINGEVYFLDPSDRIDLSRAFSSETKLEDLILKKLSDLDPEDPNIQRHYLHPDKETVRK